MKNEKPPGAKEIEAAKKLLALSPDELLLKIRECRLRFPFSTQLLDVLVVAYREVCEQRLRDAKAIGFER